MIRVPLGAGPRCAAMVVLVVLAVLGGCDAPERSASQHNGLAIVLPGAVRQAVTSDDEALCRQLTVDLTLREQSAAGAAVDHVPLTPAGVCEWRLDDEDILLGRGTYRLLARFTAQGPYPGRADCEAVGAADLWVGAYWLEDLPFPFPADFGGLSEDRFYSRPTEDEVLADIEASVGDSGLSFDLDSDTFDNLGELAGESNPCIPNQPPQVTVSASPAAVLEGEPITIDIATDEPGGLQHEVVVSLSHGYDGVAPATAEIVLRPHEPDNATVSSPLPGQTWSLDVEVVDAVSERPTAASWQITFVPDEPFIGEVLVQAVARQRNGGPTFASSPDPVTLSVENVLDPIRVVVEDDQGALVPATTLEFAELGASGAPTTLRLKAETQDIGAQVSGTLSLLSAPADMVEGEDVGFLTLTWTPDNDDAATPPAGGFPVELRFLSDALEESLITLPARVSPSFNDAPAFAPLEVVNTNLSPNAFEFKRVRFDVVDPDRVGGSAGDTPDCVVDIWPEGDAACASTCCEGAWESVACAPDGELDGDTWHMVATLRPAPDYFTLCGDAPSFVARLTFTDLVAPNADPAVAESITTETMCTPAESTNGCEEHLVLRSGGLAQATVVSGFSSDLSPEINGTTLPLIDETTRIGVLANRIDVGAGFHERVVVVVDFNDPPVVLREFDNTTELGGFQTYLNYTPAAVVDEVNHRVVGFGNIGSGNNVFFSIDLEPPYDITTWPLSAFCENMSCTGTSCGAPPTVDGQGVVWAPCGKNGDGNLTRLDGNGSTAFVDLTGSVDSGSGTPGTSVVVDDVGGEWLLWPDGLGVAAFELSTWDAPTPNVAHATGAPLWDDNRLEGYATARDRSEAYFAYNQTTGGDDMAELVRVSVEGGVATMSAPIVFGPRSLTNNGSLFHRIVLREPSSTAPVEEADLLITGGGAQDERPMIDVDNWSLLDFPRAADDYAVGNFVELYASSLPDFFVGVVNRDGGMSPLQGLIYYPWDPDQAPIEQDFGLPASGNLRQSWITAAPRASRLIINFKVVTVIEFMP